MKRLLSAAAALLCAAGFVMPVFGQYTPVAATQLKAGGVLIPSGTVTFTPVNNINQPIAVVTSDGSLNAPQGFTANVTAGLIASGFTVPDQVSSVATTASTPISYQVAIYNSATKTSYGFIIPASAPVVTGTSPFLLDHYTPSQAVTVAAAGLMSTSAIPAHCTAPLKLYTPTNPVVNYDCVGGVMVQETSSGGAATTDASQLTSGTLNSARLANIPNSALANPAITINGTSVPLGGSTTIAGTATTDASQLTTGTLPPGRLANIPNSALINPAITINGSSVPLGGSTTVSVTGGTTIAGTYDTSTQNSFTVQNEINSPKSLAVANNKGSTATFNQNIVYGYGRNSSLNASPQWTQFKNISNTLYSGVRGINQGFSGKTQFTGIGDKAFIYGYNEHVGGQTDGSGEGASFMTAHHDEIAATYSGTIASTTGTGDITPLLSAGNPVFDGGILLNITQSAGLNISGHLAGYSTNLESYLNYLPVTLATGAVSGGLPLTTAWAQYTGTVAAGTGPDAQVQTLTASFTLRAIAGTTQPLVNGHVRIVGNNSLEQGTLSACASVSAGGTTQQCTLTYRGATQGFYLFQGPLADTYLSFDERGVLGSTGFMSRYAVVGSLTGSDLIYAVLRQGNVGSVIPYGVGSSSQGTTGSAEAASYQPDVNGNRSFSAFHLYKGAEIVGNLSDPISQPHPELEQNRIAWTNGDVVKGPHPASGSGGNTLWVIHNKMTPTYPGYANSNIISEFAGPGIGAYYNGLTVQNDNPLSYYYSGGGPLGKPNGISVNGYFGLGIAFSKTPDRFGALFSVTDDSDNPSHYPWPIAQLPATQLIYFFNNAANQASSGISYGGTPDNNWYLKHDSFMGAQARFGSLLVNGKLPCLSDGTNCQTAGITSGSIAAPVGSGITIDSNKNINLGSGFAINYAGINTAGSPGGLLTIISNNSYIDNSGAEALRNTSYGAGREVLFEDSHIITQTAGPNPAAPSWSTTNQLFPGGILNAQESTSVASAATIGPTTPLFHLTGTTSVSTMTPLLGMATSTTTAGWGGSVTFIADAATPFAAGSSYGNFKAAFTTVAGTPYTCWLTPSTGLWYCK